MQAVITALAYLGLGAMWFVVSIVAAIAYGPMQEAFYMLLRLLL